MKMIVVGCGRVGAELAYRLYKNGHDVAVIDNSPAAFQNLSSDFRGRMIEGDALNRDVLHRAGIEEADGLAVVTNVDTVNVVMGHIAKSIFHVPNLVARNYDSRWRSLFEAFDLQVISSSSWGAQRIEELLYHGEIRAVFSAGNGEVELYEFAVPEAWQGHTLVELLPDSDCSLAALTRAGQARLPDTGITLQQGDVILVSATMDAIEVLRNRLNLPQEK